MDLKAALLQNIDKRFQQFREAFGRFDDASAEREMVGPKWNVRDLAGHLAHWTSEGAAQIPSLAAGKPMPDYDLEKVNEEVYRRNRRMSFVMLLPQLRAAEERFLAAVKAVPDAMLIDSPVREWIGFTGAGHYEKHWEGLKGAAERMKNSK